MPNVVKQQIILGVAFGANPDSIIKGAVSSLSEIETAKAETETPQRTDKPNDYTETESAIHDMLTESTGTNILDSGGAYGRHWQKNREIIDFRKTPQIDVTVWKDGQIDTSINIFHYLTAFLEIDETAKQLQKEFDDFADLPENENVGYLALMEDFAEKTEDYGFTTEKTWNSYNWENLLSQVIQAVSLLKNGDEYDVYVLLQIHQGCDVRGGYTRPRFFHIIDRDYFLTAMTDLNASCKCGSVYSDDCGYHWYEGNGIKENKENSLPFGCRIRENPVASPVESC